MARTIPRGYACGCETYHEFPPYVYAHTHVELVHACTCGRRNVILDARIIATEYDVKRPYVGVTSGETHA